MTFYGVKNFYKHESTYHVDFCPHCQQLAHLHSYQAIRCFHINWLPVLPLGKRRIVDHCVECEQGQEFARRDWEKRWQGDRQAAMAAARQGTLDEAEALRLLGLVKVGTKEDFLSIAPILLKQFGENAEVLTRLGRRFSYFGLHDEAVQLLERASALEDDETTRNMLTQLRTLTSYINQPPAPPNRTRQLLHLWAVPILATLATLGVLALAQTAHPTQVYLTNGLTEPYMAYINGVLIDVPAQDYVALDVDYGDVEVAPSPEVEGLWEPYTVTLDASLGERLTDARVFVLNPDRLAILAREDVVYINEDYDGPVSQENQYDYFAGQLFYTFDDIYAAFRKMPETIVFGNNNTYEYYAHLDQLVNVERGQFANYLLQQGDLETAAAFAEVALAENPQDEYLLNIYTALLEPDEAIPFLAARLEDRPVLINWHRAYQSLVEDEHPERNLEREYQQLLDADPTNQDLRYLLGRVINDPSRALRVFQEATQGPMPSAYAHHAIAYHHMIRGNFNRALAAERAARTLAPGNELFHSFESTLLMATGRYDELIRYQKDLLESEGVDASIANSLLFLYGAQGDTEAAEQFSQYYLRELEEADDQASRQMHASIMSGYAEGARDLARYAALSEAAGDDASLFRAAAARHEVARAAELVGAEPAWQAAHHLLLYAIAMHDDLPTWAETQRAAAVRALADGNRAEQQLRHWFSRGSTPPSLEDLYALSMNPGTYAVVLTALGYHHDGQRRQFHDAARQLNYTPAFPGLVLDTVL